MMAPDIVGKVLEVSEDGLSILVDSETDLVKGQIWMAITEDTDFFESDQAKLGSDEVSIESDYSNVSRDFKIGNKVSILSTGAIAESYPMQGVAVAVYSNEAK